MIEGIAAHFGGEKSESNRTPNRSAAIQISV